MRNLPFGKNSFTTFNSTKIIFSRRGAEMVATACFPRFNKLIIKWVFRKANSRKVDGKRVRTDGGGRRDARRGSGWYATGTTKIESSLGPFWWCTYSGLPLPACFARSLSALVPHHPWGPHTLAGLRLSPVEGCRPRPRADYRVDLLSSTTRDNTFSIFFLTLISINIANLMLLPKTQ